MNFYKTLSLLISETRVKLRNTYVYGLSVLVKFNAWKPQKKWMFPLSSFYSTETI